MTLHIDFESNAAALDQYGVPRTGSPLYSAVVGAEDLSVSMAFYRDHLGLDVVGQGVLSGPEFEAHWRLPDGATAEIAVLAGRDCGVGRVTLLQFNAVGRQRVRNVQGHALYGLVNLNFYAEDIGSLTKHLAREGCSPWSEPTVHDMGPTIGQPIEVMLDGPDSVILNLIQLRADNPEARVLRTLKFIMETGGFNRCGSTPVVTAAHIVSRYDECMEFYKEVLGMSVRNDAMLGGEGMESFTGFPPGARARDTYLQGNHVYGKISVIHPHNFACTDLVPHAVPPNIGLIAHSYIVHDLAVALAKVEQLGASVFSPPVELRVPGIPSASSAIVRIPGSGALHELIECG